MNVARQPWLMVRRELPRARGALLMVLSFGLPLLVWSLAAYGPFWEEAREVVISGESTRVASVYVPGDRVDVATWGSLVEAVRAENAEVAAAQGKGQTMPASERANRKALRQIVPVAVTHGWLVKAQETDDAAIREVWLGLAGGKLVAVAPELSDENLGIVKANAARFASLPADAWPKDALLKLVPQSAEKVLRPSYLVPPDVVVRSFWRELNASPRVVVSGGATDTSGERTLRQRYAESLRTIALGFLLAALIGVPLGILAGTYDLFSRLFEPFTDFFRYMPAPAFGVVLMAVFGLELGPKVMLVFLGTLPQLILVVANTTRNLEQPLLEAAQTLGASQRQLVTHVVLPGILPKLYNDLRILIGCAWSLLVIAELLGFKSGLTEIIDTKGRRFQFEYVYPAILLIGITGFATDQLLAALGRMLFPWANPAPGAFTRLFHWLRNRAGTALPEPADPDQPVPGSATP